SIFMSSTKGSSSVTTFFLKTDKRKELEARGPESATSFTSSSEFLVFPTISMSSTWYTVKNTISAMQTASAAPPTMMRKQIFFIFFLYRKLLSINSNFPSECRQIFTEIFISSSDEMRILDNGDAVGGQPVKDQRRPSPQFLGKHVLSFQRRCAVNQRIAAIHQDPGPHAVQRGYNFKPFFKNLFSYHAVSLYGSQHAHQDRLHIRGESRIRFGFQIWNRISDPPTVRY